MAKKNVTYRVFVIKNEELTYDATDLKDVLRTKLANSNVERRLIPVKEGDDSEKDLLGAFAPASNVEGAEYVYGVMMRLKPAKEFRALPDNFEQLVELMVKHDMKKVAADDAAAEIRKVNLAEFLEKGIDK